jgi:hypothetical protein
MPETVVPPAPGTNGAPNPPGLHKPATDAEAVHEIAKALSQVHQRAEQIRQAPQEHKPRLVRQQPFRL